MKSASLLRELFRQEAPRLQRFLRRFGPRVSVEDIAQESFARLCAVEGTSIESPRSYLFQTARHLALNDIRHQRTVSITPVADPDELGVCSLAPSPEEAVVSGEEAAALNVVLGALPTHLREALVLHKLEGLTQVEVADRLGVSHRTVKRYIAEALARCQLALRAQAQGND